MKRYTGSFFIALSIYALVGIFIFYTFKNENLIFKEMEKPKTISLNQVELKPRKIIEEKKVVEKEEIKEEIIEEKVEIPPKKVIKEIKKEKPIINKKPIQKEQKKEVVKKTPKKIKKEPVKKAEPKNELKEEAIEKVVETTTPQIEAPIQKKDEKKEYLEKNLILIRKLITDNIVYPRRAKKLNIQGIVTVKFKITKEGKVEDIIVLDGHNFLQKAAIEAIEEASKSFPKSQNSIEIRIPIEFKLI